MAVYTVLCCGCIYSSVSWLYMQYCVVAAYTVVCCGRIYNLSVGADFMLARYVLSLCVCERERERERVCMCVCAGVCVCVSSSVTCFVM